MSDACAAATEAPTEPETPSSAVDLDADTLSVFPIWKKLGGDLSWFESAGEQQKAIEVCIASQDLDKLLEQHPGGSDFLQPFLVADVGCNAARLLQLHGTGVAGQAEVSEISSALSSQVDDLVAQAKEEDQVRIKEDLVQLREGKLQDLTRRTKALGEVADPEESKSQNEVLAARHGEEALAQMGSDKKDTAYEDLIAERIQEHETAAFASARALLQAGAAPPKLAEILAKADQIGALEQQASSATAARQEAQGVHDALKRSATRQEQALAACESTKKAHLRAGDGKRAALKKALHGLQQADLDYRGWYIQNEALRMQIQRLKSGVAGTKQEIASAESALPETDSSCQAWLEQAEHKAEAARAQQTEAAEAVVGHAAAVIRAVTLNTRIGMELCEKVLADKDAETSSLEREKGLQESEAAVLKAELKEPCKDMRAKRTQLAQQKDKLSKLDAQIASCTQRRGEVQQTLVDAQRQYDSLKALTRYGLSIEEQDLAQTAQRLSDEAYGQFHCFAGPEQAAEDELSPSNSGVLAALPPGITAVIKDLLEEQKRSLLLQLKADLEVRGRVARSLGGSDAGDFNLVQDFGMAEHFAIASDTGSAVVSSSRLAGEPEAQTPTRGTNGGGSCMDSRPCSAQNA